MAFDSFSALIQMEGHGLYVWACYGVFFLFMILLGWLSRWERRQVISLQRQLQQESNHSAPGPDDAIGPGGGFQRIPTSRQ